MKEKSTLHTYINNSIAFLLFSTLRIFLRKQNNYNNNILFINTGQFGDLIISSLVFENSLLFNSKFDIYFLINSKYKELLNDYTGNVKIISWDYNQYKYNPIYRLKFLLKLRKLKFKQTFNLTAARGVTNDELALLSGANEVLCFKSNWKYLTKLYGRYLDSKYNQVLTVNNTTEYDKHIFLFENMFGELISRNTKIYLTEDTVLKAKNLLSGSINQNDFNKIISIAPLTDMKIKNWDLNKYFSLIEKFINQTDYFIIILGNRKQQKIINSSLKVKSKRILNLVGQTSVLEGAAIVNLSELFIGNDSGFTHIAKALNKKLIGIIGGAFFNTFFPYNQTENEIYLYHKLDCFGCEWRCTKDKPYCHENVTVDMVYHSALKLLKRL